MTESQLLLYEICPPLCFVLQFYNLIAVFPVPVYIYMFTIMLTVQMYLIFSLSLHIMQREETIEINCKHFYPHI
jgi:hypothetical protein